ncbi:DUF1120 domain-containing protein [Pseudomonas sp. NPDC086251]|uniref:DUF1120 domain-containing protein n=1 Tax=Pseudomonas sp. NPDC086251 TaxID=3364431 RepID=UPI003839CA34
MADLSVTRSIPVASCSPTFGNGGSFNFGIIQSTGTAILLPAQASTFNITCSSSATMVFNITSNRFGTAVNSSEFGWGVDSSQNPIGSYRIEFDANALLDGALGLTLSGNGTSWQSYPGTANTLPPNSQNLIRFQRGYEPRNGVPQSFTPCRSPFEYYPLYNQYKI